MKISVFVLIGVLSAITGFAQTMKEGAVVVRLSPEYSESVSAWVSRENGRKTLRLNNPVAEQIFGKYSITKFERTYPGIEKYNHRNVDALKRYYTIEGNFKRDNVMLAIIRYGAEVFEDAEPVSIPVLLSIPNDYNLQTLPMFQHLDQVHAPQAWDITTGSSVIKIGIADPTGFFFGHPDYVNSNGTNKIVYKSPNALDQYVSTVGASHGLSVAGAAAIATNNNVGISAIGYNTSLMAFGGTTNEMLSAALDADANIVEASWFNSCYSNPSDQMIMDMIYDGGTTIIVAAGNGNDGGSCPSSDGEGNGFTYPASYNHVISVSGVTGQDQYFTGTGIGEPAHLTFNSAVDVTAPGWSVGVPTTFNNSDGSFSSYGYALSAGSSFAAPMVAGLAGLILAMKPDLSPGLVEAIIKTTATNVDGVAGNAPYAGLGGTGRIDAFNAVQVTQNCFTCTNTYTMSSPSSSWPTSTVCDLELSNHTVGSTEVHNVTATKLIHITSGFQAVAGSSVHFALTAQCAALNNYVTSIGGRVAALPQTTYRDVLAAGQITITDDEVAPKTYQLTIGIFPNPASGAAQIQYSLAQPSDVKITIFDLSLVQRDAIQIPESDAGEFQLDYDVSKLPKGLYLYRIDTNHGSIVQRLSVTR